MKWYFALSETTIDRPGHDWLNMIRVAVQSATQNTNLEPTMLYDGGPSAFISELISKGVNVIYHRVAFYDALERHGRGDPAYLGIASGAFLRFDIPVIEKDQEFVLYTDCDVIFRCHPDFFQSSRPDFFAATAQMSLNPAHDMNSGVMLMNIANMRHAYDDLIQFTCNHLHVGFDQEILRIYFDKKYAPMDLSLNWKPYWGVNPAAQIIHFHGPKPASGRTFEESSRLAFHPDWLTLYERSPGGYEQYGADWQAALNNATSKVNGAHRHESGA